MCLLCGRPMSSGGYGTTQKNCGKDLIKWVSPVKAPVLVASDFSQLSHIGTSPIPHRKLEIQTWHVKYVTNPKYLLLCLLSEHCVLCTYISAFHKTRKRGHQYPEFVQNRVRLKRNLQKTTLAFKGGWHAMCLGCVGK
jgi:hypothetical protein